MRLSMSKEYLEKLSNNKPREGESQPYLLEIEKLLESANSDAESNIMIYSNAYRDPILNHESLSHLLVILIKINQEREKYDAKSLVLIDALVESFGYLYRSAKLIYLCDSSLWDISQYRNLLSIKQNNANMIESVFRGLSPSLQNAENLKLILEVQSHIEYIHQSMQDQKPSVQSQEDFKHFIKELVSNHNKIIIGQNVLNLLPKKFHTDENLEMLKDVYKQYIDPFRYGRYIGADGKPHKKEMDISEDFMSYRVTVAEVISHLPESVQTQDMFASLCLLKHYDIKTICDMFSKIPNNLQSTENLKALLNAGISKSMFDNLSEVLTIHQDQIFIDLFIRCASEKRPEVEVKEAIEAWKSLPAKHQTQKILFDLLTLRDGSGIVAAWRLLPTLLQNQNNLENFIELLYKRQEREVVAYALLPWVNLPVGLQTQANLDAFFSKNIISSADSEFQHALAQFNKYSETIKNQNNFDSYLKFAWDKSLNASCLNSSAAPFNEFTQKMFDVLLQGLAINNNDTLEDEISLLEWFPPGVLTYKNLKAILPDEKGVNQSVVKAMKILGDGHLFPSGLLAEEKNFEEIIKVSDKILDFMGSKVSARLRSAYRDDDFILRDQASLNKFLEIMRSYKIASKVQEENDWDSDTEEESVAKELKLGSETAKNIQNLIHRIEAINYLTGMISWDTREHIDTSAMHELISESAEAVMAFKGSTHAQEVKALLDQIPYHLMSQQVVAQLITIASTTNVEEQARLIVAFGRMIIRLLEEPAEVKAQAFNVRQSTHTASVHKSISESALRLMQSYGDKIKQEKDLNTVIKEVEQWFSKPLEEKLAVPQEQFQAATFAVNRIVEPRYAFVDPKSDVSTLQLLALVWLGIEDQDKRSGKLEDARAKMVVALYDIQRGYNLDDQFKDNKNDRDTPICTAGTFNKLMESLWGIHADVQIVYITKELAALKIPKLTADIVEEFLINKKQSCQTHAEEENYISLLTAIKTEGIEAIWPEIEPKLKTEMFNEYGSVFKNEEDSEFTDLIASALWVDVAHLPWDAWLDEAELMLEKSGGDVLAPLTSFANPARVGLIFESQATFFTRKGSHEAKEKNDTSKENNQQISKKPKGPAT